MITKILFIRNFSDAENKNESQISAQSSRVSHPLLMEKQSNIEITGI